MANFFKDRKQMIVLNGQDSSSADVTAGVLQESILRLLLCLSFINDLATGPFLMLNYLRMTYPCPLLHMIQMRLRMN